MARHSSPPTDFSTSLFRSEPTSGFALSKFWLSVGRYRPILLVGGVWLVLICLAAVAYNRLMFTGTPPEPIAGSAEVQTRSQISLDGPNADSQSLSPGSSLESFTDSAEFDSLEVSPGSRPSESVIPPWSLGLLVGVCALSCLGISSGVRASRHRAKRNAALKKKDKQVPKQALKPAAAKGRLPARAAKPVRLSPYSSERDAVLIPEAAQKQRSPNPSPRSRFRAGSRLAQPQSVSPRPQPVTGNLAHKVAVVPEGQALALDWQEASLADNLDLRQRRSLSSLL